MPAPAKLRGSWDNWDSWAAGNPEIEVLELSPNSDLLVVFVLLIGQLKL